MIRSRLEWDRTVRADPWLTELTFLVWPILSAQPYVYLSEADLHSQISTVLRDADVPFIHEASLGTGMRIDFVSRRIGMEIKVAGRASEITKQLQRYGYSGKLRALLLLTSCPSHTGISESGYGIPTAIINLAANRSILASLKSYP